MLNVFIFYCCRKRDLMIWWGLCLWMCSMCALWSFAFVFCFLFFWDRALWSLIWPVIVKLALKAIGFLHYEFLYSLFVRPSVPLQHPFSSIIVFSNKKFLECYVRWLVNTGKWTGCVANCGKFTLVTLIRQKFDMQMFWKFSLIIRFLSFYPPLYPFSTCFACILVQITRYLLAFWNKRLKIATLYSNDNSFILVTII